MTTRPSVDQARAYADALVAWAEGKRVEWKSRDMSNWVNVQDHRYFPDIATAHSIEFRVAPAPPKLREFWVFWKGIKDCTFTENCKTHVAHSIDPEDVDYIHVREVSETADAEMAELRRNHDALAKLADEIISVGREGCLNFWDESHVLAVLDKHGAILK